MKKFEYLRIEFKQWPNGTELNYWGDEGWQLVNLTSYMKNYTFSEYVVLAYFKREKSCQ